MRLRIPAPRMPRVRIRGPRIGARRDERGSFTLIVVFWALITMVLGGLVVDGALAITERQRIGDIAEQAARAGADDLNLDDLRNGLYTLAGDFKQRCDDVFTASGLVASPVNHCFLKGTITLRGGQTVPVVEADVTFTYSPILLSAFFTTDFTANASATAYPQPGF